MGMIVWLVGVGYMALTGIIGCLVVQLKLINAVVDNQPNIVDNKDFLDSYSWHIKVSKQLEKIWPRIKRATLSDVSGVTYKWVTILFFSLLFLQYLFSDFLASAAPAVFVCLGFLAGIGNSLQGEKRSAEASKYLLLPFSILFPLFISYNIDNSSKLLAIKGFFAARPLGYEATLAILVVGLGVFCYFGIGIIERIQKAIVLWLLKRALVLSRNMVLVGVAPKMPEEKEMRAIAKEAIVVTAKNMAVFGALVGVLVGAIHSVVELF